MVRPMKNKYSGIVISVVVHVCIILPLMAASFFEQVNLVKVVEIDFSLAVNSSSEGLVSKAEKSVIHKKPGKLKPGRASGRLTAFDEPAKQNSANIPAKEKNESTSVPTIVAALDNQGEIGIRGTPATYADSSGTESFLSDQGGSAGGGGGTGGSSGSGRGMGSVAGGGGDGALEEGKDYNYIRDAVMKNIEYPEYARRMGVEGKTLLSFIVLENGTTSQIKIVKSSGSRFLDDSAKEGVARTVISKKVPYRIVVRLPIAYKLRVSMYERDKNT